MAEAKEKKIRVNSVATMINIPSEDIISFLQKKGFAVKTVNSIVTPEMMTALEANYKKAMEVARKHKDKVEEYHTIIGSSRGSKEDKANKAGKKTGEGAAETEEVEVTPAVEEAAPETEVIPEEIPEVEAAQEEAAPVVEENIEPEPVEVVEAPQVVEEAPVVEAEAPAVVVEPKKEEPFPAASLSPMEEARKRKRGLKILGTIKEKEKPVQAKPNRAEETETSNEKPAGTTSGSSSSEEDKKKKRKKKSKTKKKVDTPEDILVVKKKQKVKKFEIDQKEIDKNIRTTLLGLDEASSLSARALMRKKKKKEREEEVERLHQIAEAEKNKITVTEFIAVNELANLMDVSVADVISKCIGLGMMVSINQRLDVETITYVADEFGFEVEFAKEYEAESLEDIPDEPETLLTRSPVVTIMGHVDHGKTSLLDHIRNANVVAGESGGITQHIGAYRVQLPNGREITFLDTPGHEAFTAMRARGAQVTDIVVLVVAADDAVMPQTIEAINHAQAANVPIIVAINKIDRPEANSERIKQQLGDKNILVEEWGGKYQCVELSAKTGKNVDLLLEKILLEADVLELKANPNRDARGVVLESELDKGRGITATVLVQKGTLHVGDPFIAGVNYGRVRAMFDERKRRVDAAPPSTPVMVLGFEGAPQAGDVFIIVESEREARSVANKRQQLKREQDNKQVHHITLDEISRQISMGGVKELPVIVKGDVDGSVEALSDSLMKLSTEEVIVRVIHRGVGAISEGDVLLADASNAIIIGFHVRPNVNARKLAETQKVDIRIYNIIYDAINEVKAALEGLLSPIISEEVTATVEVRDIFKVPKFGTVAGCYVTDGKIFRNNKIRLVRDGIVVLEGDIASLKRFKDDVREVDSGYECGISISNFNDIKVGDVIEAYKIIETKKKLI